MRQQLRFLLALLALGACGTPTDQEGPPPLLTQLPRALSPAELHIVEAANAFAFDLLRQATRNLEADRNAFLSPLSASMALGMAINGANGETFDGMLSALRLAGMSEAEVDHGYRDLMGLLGGLDTRTEMRIANSIWGREGLPIEPTFIEAGQSFFGAEVTTLDFASPGAVETINQWVSQKTNDRIPRLLESISPEEVMFLINAIYFKGKWRQAFDRSETRSRPFHGADGQDRTASLMRQQRHSSTTKPTSTRPSTCSTATARSR